MKALTSTSFLVCGIMSVFVMLCPLFAHAAWRPPLPATSQTASSGSSGSSVSSSFILPILTYHYVENIHSADDQLRRSLSVSPAQFEKQLQSLFHQGITTTFVRDIPSLLRAGKASNSVVALTFDDGYADFYSTVFPLLQKYHTKATVFVITDFIGKPGYLMGSELRQLADSELVEIGAHTVHHRNLTALSQAAARHEIAESKRDLEKELGVTVKSFAYPFGKTTPRITGLVDEAGFEAAVSTERGSTQSTANILTLRRIPAGAFMGNRKWRAIGLVQ